MSAEPVTIVVDDTHSISGLLWAPLRSRACYLLAHGAGAGMTHPFMQAVAAELAERRIATLRYQFPYMERRAGRPDPPGLAHATVRAAAAPALHPLQQAFIDVQALHCGYCYNGMTIKGSELLAQNPRPSEAEIRAHMNGHLCRCGTYPRVMAAIRLAGNVMAGD